MKLLTTIEQLKEWRREQAGRVALIPTMGNLHHGHGQLCRQAKEYAPTRIVSLFVNPTQFSSQQESDAYPRSLEADTALLEELGVDAAYAPSVEQLYHPFDAMTITIGNYHQVLEGAVRPGHFSGVAQVLLKLFHLIQPDCALFGKKDYQQLRLVESMVAQLNMDIQVVGGDTVRDAHGVALSSRNQFLTEPEKAFARTLYPMLTTMAQSSIANKKAMAHPDRAPQLTSAPGQLEYLALYDQRLAKQYQCEQPLPPGAYVILIAMRFSRTRLLDNIEFTIE